MNALWREFSKGLWKDLPPFKLVLGLCPTLAVTATARNGLGMGVAVIFVLTLSNGLVSLLRRWIPEQVRIACYIVIAATLVVAVELFMQAYAYTLYQALGIFVPLIVVNCLILGRAEAFAGKNPVHLALADGLGIGIGFALSLTVLGAVREILGKGTFFDAPVTWQGFEPFGFMGMAPGAFIALGLIVAAINFLNARMRKARGKTAPPATSACAACQGCGLALNPQEGRSE